MSLRNKLSGSFRSGLEWDGLRLSDLRLRLQSVELLRHSRLRLSVKLLRHSRLRHSWLRLPVELLRCEGWLRHSRLRLSLEWNGSGLSWLLLLEMGEGLNLLDRLLGRRHRHRSGRLLPYQFLDRQESLINILSDIYCSRSRAADNLGSGQCSDFWNFWHPELLLGCLLPDWTDSIVSKDCQLGGVKDP